MNNCKNMLGRAALRLSETEMSSLQKLLPSWSVSESQLQREYRFASFGQAWDFMRLVRAIGTSHKDFPQCKNHSSTVHVTLQTPTGRHASLARFIDKAEVQIKAEPDV